MKDNIDRPYFSNSIVDLESFAESNWTDGRVLLILAIELFHRKTQRAVALRTSILERLSELIAQGFAWPSTEAEPTNNDSPIFIDAPSTGLLSYLGYRVGVNGLNPEERCGLLDTVYTHRLPQLNSVEYMNDWATPRTAQRLRKMADSIAAFARNAKRQQNAYEQAIADWDDDLHYLYTKYYVGQFDFYWPNTTH